jgi:DNA polymerase V
MLALFDCNSFYCEAERVMRPSLRGVPLVVASNQDGCVVSRSEEAKALGVRMGHPVFELKQQRRNAGLVVLSSNFPYYAEISERVFSLLDGFSPMVERASIDEAFASCDGLPGDITHRARRMRQRIIDWVGIPCGVGIASTKTLAKLATHVAKKAERTPGSYPVHLSQVCNLDAVEPSVVSEIMERTDVSDVWGVGPRLTQQLRDAGVATALELRRLDPAMVRNRWSVVLERTVLELNGVQCFNVEDVPGVRKEIACTRSFASPVRSLQILEEAVGEFVQRAAVKLRKQGSVAGQVLVFLRTSPFRSGPRHTPHAAMQTLEATNDSRVLAGLALMGLRMIHRGGYDYMRAGVVLQDLSRESQRQAAFEFDLQERGSEVMGVVDALNQRYGRGTIGLGGSMVDQRPALEDWRPRQSLLTPCYTTRWSDIPVALA